MAGIARFAQVACTLVYAVSIALSIAVLLMPRARPGVAPWFRGVAFAAAGILLYRTWRAGLLTRTPHEIYEHGLTRGLTVMPGMLSKICYGILIPAQIVLDWS
jgi:hypothetical protein